MKNAARITLGVVLAMLIALVAPRPVSRAFAPDASAQIASTPEPTVHGDDNDGGNTEDDNDDDNDGDSGTNNDDGTDDDGTDDDGTDDDDTDDDDTDGDSGTDNDDGTDDDGTDNDGTDNDGTDNDGGNNNDNPGDNGTDNDGGNNNDNPGDNGTDNDGGNNNDNPGNNGGSSNDNPGNNGGSSNDNPGNNGGSSNDNPGDNGGTDNGGSVDDEPEPFFGYNRIDGAFNTDLLLAVEARLRSLGWSRADITKEVFAPFIIGGRANWIDSWGFPRFGPGPIVRTHEGQDVFCEMGEEVLATEKGTIDFADGGLGGKIARLHRADGSYWYYAHLADWNIAEFKTGDEVEPGDVIGYCGNTGNASGGAPHVHFGWYGADGNAKNPMPQLVKRLRTAERLAIAFAQSAADGKLRRQDIFAAAHRFGDAFAPSLEEFDISGDPLLSSGTTPASGAFALAQTALQGAIAQSDLNGTLGTSPTTGGSSTSNSSGASLAGSSNESGD